MQRARGGSASAAPHATASKRVKVKHRCIMDPRAVPSSKMDILRANARGWRASWGAMGGQAMKGVEIALAGPHTCYWVGS